MQNKINWIHISDLHYGQNKQDLLLPKVKQELFKDITKLKNKIGKFDIVFFTGDLTQSGQKSEYDELTLFLKQLWDHFNKLDCNPLLFAIPGNHDLLRDDPNKAAIRGLKKYNSDPELQGLFWDEKGKGKEYHETVEKSFHYFLKWYKEVDLPKPPLKFGMIPGDISTSVKINGVTLNCVGLNTAFLELTKDDYLGKLAINNRQVIELTGPDPYEWLKEGDICLFLTHHDPTWLDKDSIDTYNSDINPPDTYLSHLCGHLHKQMLRNMHN